ncbi:extracellular solute-binding protein [Ancylobacter sp. Lp-2]|uniref:ABC transporter substrate-binding protein n=1 Tax=Ancylobacter sp. Lp-2 TaxID=2881339 RepID=UPI001E289F59|nr:extracellular solute-binding protein [Ancylobacter sp. Lp-2]MCB4770408.1 extracellular solute-binding protein [Ancylobacter sp. Lp-2]
MSVHIWGRAAASLCLGSALLFASGAHAEVGSTLEQIIQLAKKEPPLQIATQWAGPIISESKKAFQEKYGLVVEHQFVSGLDDRERILNEALTGRVNVDLVAVSGDLRDKFVSAGVLQKVDWSKLFPDISPAMISPNGYYLGTGINQFVIAYNNKLVSAADAPKNWSDCLDPKWKGKVGVYSRPLAFVQLYIKWGPDRSTEYHTALKNNQPVWVSSPNNVASLLASGEYSIVCGIGYQHLKTILYNDPSSPISIVVPKEYPYQVGEAVAVMKGGKAPNSAILFAGFMATDGAKYYDLFGQSNPLKEGTEAQAMVSKAGAEPFWAGWESDGKAQSVATRAVVTVWGFPTGR